MQKLLVFLSASAMAAALLGSSAQAWDNCGHGFHRNFTGFCCRITARHPGVRTAIISAGTCTPASRIDRRAAL